MPIILAGGGTAGHTSPLIATAERLRELSDVDLLCIGTPKGLESRVIPAAGLELALIPPVPLPRRITPALFSVPGRLGRAVAEAGAILRRHQAEVVVGFGGYVSLPVYLAAWRAKLPIILHEGNAVPGLANRVAARFTPWVATTFPNTALPHAQQVGLPVRAAIAGLDRAAGRSAACAQFGLPADGPVLLVSGGSQGARSLNQAVIGARTALLAAGISILHVLGPANLTEETVAVVDPDTGAGYRPVGYVDEMGQAYAAADLMVGRSGAGTVMETAMIGLPTIFVPLPHGNGEQARNADFLIQAEAGLLVPDAELTAVGLTALVTELFADPQRLAAMSATCSELAPSGAADALARLVLRVAGRPN
ncbi:undecaprenyldiphospho-muramoylpentapeptide beta-N-acetylglucosaminyltransferase [Propionicimonas paludicola]|uniref:undecaprenyldiphospho-muramoylpentapeptide beta-N-acetylglucosaminyltransferase n=1 Tax=Propionicimonas paludicola TaxID=185243 RepID=UPI000BF4BCBB